MVITWLENIFFHLFISSVGKRYNYKIHICMYICNYEIPGLRPCHDTGVSSPVALIRWLWRSDDILEQETFFYVHRRRFPFFG